jgi:hypothetical protein
LGVQIINGKPATMVAVGSDEWRNSMITFMDEIVADSGGEDD